MWNALREFKLQRLWPVSVTYSIELAGGHSRDGADPPGKKVRGILHGDASDPALRYRGDLAAFLVLPVLD